MRAAALVGLGAGALLLGSLLLRPDPAEVSGDAAGGRALGGSNERSVGADPGELAPDFAMPTTDGRFRLSQHRGDVVVLNFLAPG